MSNSGYNFTQQVRAALSRAREESRKLDHEYVGTEHILLGLLHGEDGVAIMTLNNLGVDRAKVRQDVIDIVKRGKPGQEFGEDLPYTSRAKKVLELSMHEALNLHHTYVGPEHVLLGLLLEEKGAAAQVLQRNGATVGRVRAEVLRILGSADQTAASSSPSQRGHIGSSSSAKEVESVTIKVRFIDGSFEQEVFKDMASAARHLAP